MEEMSISEKDIRRLLKTFGVKVDQAIQEQLERYPQISPLRVRLVLVDLTNYGDGEPQPRLHLEIEGDIHSQ